MLPVDQKTDIDSTLHKYISEDHPVCAGNEGRIRHKIPGRSKSVHGLTDKLNITRIPAFILTENDIELSCITEFAYSTLENNMVEILTKKIEECQQH